jgi:hypothetical protein
VPGKGTPEEKERENHAHGWETEEIISSGKFARLRK